MDLIPYLPLIGGVLGLFGGDDEQVDEQRIEYYDPYAEGEAAEHREALWDEYWSMFEQSQEYAEQGFASIDEAKAYYRRLAERRPEAVDQYVSDVLRGKYADLQQNPYFRGMMEATSGTFTRTMNELYSEQNRLGAGLGGGGAASLGRERQLRQTTPMFTDAMSQLSYQAYQAELNRMQGAAGLGLQSYGLQQNALSTAAAGMGHLGMFGANYPLAVGAGLLGLLPEYRTQVGGQVSTGYAQSGLSQIGSELMGYWGMQQGQAPLPVTTVPAIEQPAGYMDEAMHRNMEPESLFP